MLIWNVLSLSLHLKLVRLYFNESFNIWHVYKLSFKNRHWRMWWAVFIWWKRYFERNAFLSNIDVNLFFDVSVGSVFRMSTTLTCGAKNLSMMSWVSAFIVLGLFIRYGCYQCCLANDTLCLVIVSTGKGYFSEKK